MTTNLHGVMAFLPTPFTADGDLDLAATESQVDFLVAAGVSSVVVSGGVGEFYTLSRREHADLVRAAVSVVAGRIPVVAGVGHSTAIAAGLGRQPAEAGAAAIMVNPLYFVRAELRGLVAHYRAIGAAAELPLIVFSTDGATYGPDELEALAEVPEVAALKDEHGDLELFAGCRARLGDRYTWINGMAEPHAFEYAAAGAQAMTSGLVNLAPELSLAIWDAALRGDQPRFAGLMARAEPILAMRRSRPGYHTTVLKEGMAILGRTSPLVRLPLVALRTDERETLRTLLADVPTAAVG
jgi:5-dehydro-4-deoxyglucarate dehydratase